MTTSHTRRQKEGATGRKPWRRGVCSLLLMLSLVWIPAVTATQDGVIPAEPLPELETLAEGALPTGAGDQVAWRLVRDTAEPAGEAGAETRAAGFGVPEADPILTTNLDNGEVREFGPGEAFYAAEESTTRRESVSDAAVPYQRIALVAADAANDPGGDTLLVAGDPFELRPERDDLLLRLEAGSVDERPASINQVWPSLLIVTEGSVTILPEETGVTLAVGEAVVLDGTFAASVSGVVATSGEARFLLARIVAADDPGTGFTVWPGEGVRVAFSLSVCPEDTAVVDLGETTGGAGPPPCRAAQDDGDDAIEPGEFVEPAPLPGEDVVLTAQSTGDVVATVADPEGRAGFDALPPGEYAVEVPAAAAMTSRCRIAEIGDPAEQLTPEYSPNIALGPVLLTAGQVLTCELITGQAMAEN